MFKGGSARGEACTRWNELMHIVVVMADKLIHGGVGRVDELARRRRGESG